MDNQPQISPLSPQTKSCCCTQYKSYLDQCRDRPPPINPKHDMICTWMAFRYYSCLKKTKEN